MGVYICRKCGKQYESHIISNGYCEACNIEYNDKYHQVREYLWAHPNTTADVIAKECDCSIHQVMKWVKEERFYISSDSKVTLYCEICGQKIFSGRYCQTCKASVAKNKQEAEKASRIKQHAENMHGTSTASNTTDDSHMRFLK